MIGSKDNPAARRQTTSPVGTGLGKPARRRLVGVQFRRASGVVYDFLAGELALRHDQRVVVEAERGEELGWVVGETEEREPYVDGPIRRVLRVATSDDLSRDEHRAGLEREALRFAASRVREADLPMKMVAAEWSHSGGKITFYFSSEERPDFRELVKELAQRYRSRIEMRHVSPRDETKIIGALGPCGRETCCSSWLRAFSPVTIQMAKDQGLAINPQKVAGVCGRLLCCLSFEQDTYADLRRKLPRYGRNVQTPKGRGRVVDVLTLRGRVRVQLEEGGYAEFAASEVTGGGKAPTAEGAAASTDGAATRARATATPTASASSHGDVRSDAPPSSERPTNERGARTRPSKPHESRSYGSRSDGSRSHASKPDASRSNDRKTRESKPKDEARRASSPGATGGVREPTTEGRQERRPRTEGSAASSRNPSPGTVPAAVEAGAMQGRSGRRDHRRKRGDAAHASQAAPTKVPQTAPAKTRQTAPVKDAAPAPASPGPKASPTPPATAEAGGESRRSGGRRHTRRGRRSDDGAPN